MLTASLLRHAFENRRQQYLSNTSQKLDLMGAAAQAKRKCHLKLNKNRLLRTRTGGLSITLLENGDLWRESRPKAWLGRAK
jgi:hypothetical protein